MNENELDGIMEKLLRKKEAGPRVVVDLEVLQRIATEYFDGRRFNVGDVIVKRADSADIDKGGLCNFRHPLRGEPAIVIGHIPPERLTPNDDGSYERQDHIILCQMANDNRVIRMTVDVQHFELYKKAEHAESESKVE